MAQGKGQSKSMHKINEEVSQNSQFSRKIQREEFNHLDLTKYNKSLKTESTGSERQTAGKLYHKEKQNNLSN